jgi:hypothetical protein
MFESPPRYRVRSAKGPYVGYGVWDALGNSWLTEVDLPAAKALRIMADLVYCATPRDLRTPEAIRPVIPPRPTLIAGAEQGSALLGLWIRAPSGWAGYVLVDGAMTADWVNAEKLRPEEVSQVRQGSD